MSSKDVKLLENSTAIILCGGRGTRLGALGKKIPKTLAKVNKREILWYILNHLKISNFKNIILPLGYKGHLIKKFLKKNNNFGLNIKTINTGIRTNIGKSSDLCNDITPDHKWIFNNILIDHSPMCKYNNPPSILGCFQLYFKNNVYHKDNLDDAGWGDFDFCHNNFKLFCSLENIVYLHLGVGGKNWKGKKEYFIDNCKINLEQIFYNCNIKCENNYYNEKREKIDINKKDCTFKLTNIFEDVWTCSDEFREDIKMFFKDNSDYKIAEIGSHKGYTTRYLSEIFEKVYAVDNSIKWTNFNKEFNKDKKNIEYIHLDIYKDSWNVIPDVDIVFIDAQHTYTSCKSDIYNSIKQFKNLKYIIFDDYGVWSGVRQIVNELLLDRIIVLEKYIGLNNVPGLNDNILKNTSEGIICKLNYTIHLINKKYNWGNSSITFLKDGKMRAFGPGKYTFIDKYLIKCTFGGKIHLLKFNQDYSKFISIRKDDLITVIGNKYN